jgi:hypothetical protein
VLPDHLAHESDELIHLRAGPVETGHQANDAAAGADVGRLLAQANLILNREETRTVLRVTNVCTSALWINGHAEVTQHHKRAHLRLVTP